MKDDAGQALIMALIIVLMFTLLPMITFVTLQSVQPQTTASLNYDAALAAAQAGLQEYRSLLDQYSGYALYSGANQPPSSAGGCNPAFTGGSGSCPTKWATVANTHPVESYVYTPNSSQLNMIPNGSAVPYGGQVLLTVVGRAGTGPATTYRTIEGSLGLSGALQDVYFSTFEQPGPADFSQWENDYSTSYPYYPLGQVTPGSGSSLGAYAYDEGTEPVAPAPSGVPANPAAGQTYAQALCQYDAWQPNLYVDWYSQNVNPVMPPTNNGNVYPSNGAYSPSNPYYGPWYGFWNDPKASAAGYGSIQFGSYSYSGGACTTNYVGTGNSFNGPVYSQDEITTCGSPSFTSLATQISQFFQFPANWPGTRPPASGANYSLPYGYVNNLFHQTNGCSGSPSFSAPQQPQFGETQTLPPIADQIATQIEQGTVAGCVYTGPTMLHFYYNPSTQKETMFVWSPLTKNPHTSQGPANQVLPAPVTCGQFNNTTDYPNATGPPVLCGGTGCTYNSLGQPNNTQVQNVSGTPTVMGNYFAAVPVQPGEVIWVQNTPLSVPSASNYWSTLPAAESKAPTPGCIDPWVQPNNQSPTSAQTCSEGDLMVGGVTHGG
ncbi:MAG: hypothetical protein ACYDBS_09960, partial [Acidimicrobiales bacterium]